LIVKANSPIQAAEIANTVWTEGGAAYKKVCVVEMMQPDGRVGVVMEPERTPYKFEVIGGEMQIASRFPRRSKL
jgi:hypothetical protein